jgi:creatinine amidohydrolase/Fe(II)-dependent formamide hydrolase-like protein
MAHGIDGVWGRWREYVNTNGHGGNTALKTIITKEPNYAIENFSFSLLEYYKEDISIEDLRSRESYWKTILRSRSLDGLNRN